MYLSEIIIAGLFQARKSQLEKVLRRSSATQIATIKAEEKLKLCSVFKHIYFLNHSEWNHEVMKQSVSDGP